MDPETTLSGLTVDGVAVPLHIEAEGAEAIAAHLASAVPAVVETAPNPPTDAEGDEA